MHAAALTQADLRETPMISKQHGTAGSQEVN